LFASILPRSTMPKRSGVCLRGSTRRCPRGHWVMILDGNGRLALLDDSALDPGLAEVAIRGGLAFIFASSAESVGAFWLGEIAEVVQESQLRHFERSETIRLSRHQFHLVIEPLHRTR